LFLAIGGGENKKLPLVFDALLKKGADVNSTTDRGWPLVFWAADSCRLDTLKMLIDAGADCNVTRNDGKTPLQVAAKYGNYGIVECLIL